MFGRKFEKYFACLHQTRQDAAGSTVLVEQTAKKNVYGVRIPR